VSERGREGERRGTRRTHQVVVAETLEDFLHRLDGDALLRGELLDFLEQRQVATGGDRFE